MKQNDGSLPLGGLSCLAEGSCFHSTYLCFLRYLCNGPSGASSITSIMLSSWHIPDKMENTAVGKLECTLRIVHVTCSICIAIGLYWNIYDEARITNWAG